MKKKKALKVAINVKLASMRGDKEGFPPDFMSEDWIAVSAFGALLALDLEQEIGVDGPKM